MIQKFQDRTQKLLSIFSIISEIFQIKSVALKFKNVQIWEYEIYYSETLNNEYIERIHQMSYSVVSDNGMLQILSFLIK